MIAAIYEAVIRAVGSMLNPARNGETGMAWHPVALQLLPALCDRSCGRTDRELVDVADTALPT